MKPINKNAPRVNASHVNARRVSQPRWAISEAEVTPEAVFKERRVILKALGLGVLGTGIPVTAKAGLFDAFADKTPTFVPTPLQYTSPKRFQDLSEPLTGEVKITTHNNFYEFGTDKADPAQYAQGLITNPWQLRVDGLVDTPLELDHDDLLKLFPLEERIYRLRCVEAWSMVIPWLGFPLAALLVKAGVKSSATHVAFETLFDPKQMPGQRNRIVGGGVDYPYVEGLTVAEAMNELSLLSVGLYGKTLPPQNGAPIRLVVPWKYGFKSIKSVVRITLMDKQPPTSWNALAPEEYGFFANVNPAVDHPRWSQASERRIGSGGVFSASRIPTRLFNGYEAEVGHLYSNLDLSRFY